MPKFATRLMGATSGEMVAKLIEKRMLTPTLERFRQLVMRDEEEMAAQRKTATENTNNTLEQQFFMMQDDNYEYQQPKLAFPDHHQEEEEREVEVNTSDAMFIPSRFSPVVPQDS
jgi:hypothetical protein